MNLTPLEVAKLRVSIGTVSALRSIVAENEIAGRPRGKHFRAYNDAAKWINNLLGDRSVAYWDEEV